MIGKIIILIKQHIALIVLIIITGIVYSGWFRSGVVIGADFQYRPAEYLHSLCDYGTWDPLLYGGNYTVSAGQLSRSFFFNGACQLSYFFDYEIIQRIMWLFPILIIGIYSIYKLSNYLFKNSFITFFIGLFFMVNPTILERIQRGHVWMPLVYVLFPLVFYYLIKLLNENKYQLYKILQIALWSGILFIIEFRMAILVMIFLFIFHIFYLFFIQKNVGKFYLVWLINVATILVLNLFWILPLLLYPPAELYSADMSSTAALVGAGKFSGNLINSFQLFPISWSSFYSPVLFVIPIMSFGQFLFIDKINNKKTKLFLIFLGISTLILIFLGKGTFDPLGVLYVWMAQNIPFFIAYRVSNKFLLIAALPYSIIFGYSFHLLFRGCKRKIIKFGTIIIVSFMFLYGTNFIIRGYYQEFSLSASYYKNEPNMFWPKKIDEQLLENWNSLEESSDYSRTIWFPAVNRYRLATPTHANISLDMKNDASDGVGTFFDIDKGQFYKKNIHNISNYMYWSGINSIMINGSDTPDWNYTKKYNYSKIVSSFFNTYDVTAYNYEIVRNYDIINGMVINNGNSYDLDYLIDDDSDLDGKLLKIEFDGKVAETVNIIISDKNNFNINRTESVIGSGKGQTMLIPLDGLYNISKIKLANIVSLNKMNINSIMLIKSDSILFNVNEKDYKYLDLIDTKKYQARNIKYDKKTKILNESSAATNTIQFYQDKIINLNSTNSFIDLKLRLDLPENIFITIADTAGNTIKGDAKFIGGKELNSFLFYLPDSFNNVASISFENVYYNNAIYFDQVEMVVQKKRPENLVLSKVFATKNVLSVENGIPVNCQSFEYIDPAKSKLIIVQNSDIDDMGNYDRINKVKVADCSFKLSTINSIQLSSISVEMVEDSNTQKKIKILKEKVDEQYVLVFIESYDKNWELISENNSDVKLKHIRVNGNMNGWIIDGESEYDVFTLNFKPQRVYEIGLRITTGFAGIVMLFVMFSYLFKNYEYRKKY